MSDQLVPTVHTPMAPAAVYAALASAWTALLGTQPTRAELLVLLAQWAHETDAGAKSNNWNLGGIKYTKGDGHDYTAYLTAEVYPRDYAQHLIDAGDAVLVADLGDKLKVELTQRFRAYASLGESAFDYLRTLRRDFGFAWPAVEAGDVADFGHRLKIRAYYTDTEAVYVAGLERWRAQLDAAIPTDPVGALANGAPAVVLPDPLGPEVEPPDEIA